MKNILLLAIGCLVAIALFGDGGLDVSPELSNEMRADFNYADNSTNDTYNIERWVENENNFFSGNETSEVAVAEETNLCIRNGEDICAATALPPIEGISLPNFGMPATLPGLEQWASQNGVNLPNLWNAWNDQVKYDWLKSEWEARQ